MEIHQYQPTITGDIFNADNMVITKQTVQNPPELIAALEAVRAQLEAAMQAEDADSEVIIDADAEVHKALTEAKKPAADKGKIQAFLEQASGMLEPVGKVASATAAIAKLIEMFGG